MSQDHFLELVPLAALGVLDGDERTGFDAHMPGCVVCHAEFVVYEKVAALIPLGLTATPPGSRVRERVLGLPARPGAGWPALVALAASVVLGVGLLAMRSQRDAARAEVVATHAAASEAVAFRALVQRPGSRVTALGGLAPAPTAHARVIWDPETREAVLVASGLAQAPAGQAYEAWVIAGGAPVAAGTFRPDAHGRALLRLPALAETAAARTFAVTLEPEAGVSAPSGPMLLAGGV
jgi:anti-sigma-K factor RskA